MRALLDVNVLVALLDSSHLHHATATATDWLAEHAKAGWARVRSPKTVVFASCL